MASKKTAAAKKPITSKDEKRRLEDMLFYRIFAVFTYMIVCEVLLFALYRAYYNDCSTVLINACLTGFGTIALGVSVFAINRIFKSRKSGTPELVYIYAAGLALLTFCFCAFSIWGDITAVKLLCVLCPVLAILHLIQLTYQPEFFILATLGAAGIFAVLLAKRYALTLPVRSYFLIIFVALMTVGGFILGALARKKGGTLKFFGASRFFALPQSSLLFFPGCAAVFCALLLSLIFSFAYTTLSVVILSVLLFVSAIYYTIGLM